jgi:predicted DNA-binding transcriptional regulator AlpA
MNLYSVQKNASLDETHDESNRRDVPSAKLNVSEAAQFLGLSVSTLNKLRLSGNGPPYMKFGHRVLYDLRDVEGWACEHRRFHTSESPLKASPKKASR